jgi:hypothetical protein
MKQPVPVATYLAMIDQLAEEGHIDALTSQERTNFALCYAESGLSQKIIRRIAKQQFAAEDDLLEQPAESRPSVSTSIETLPPENQSGSWPTGCGPTDPPRPRDVPEAYFYPRSSVLPPDPDCEEDFDN